MDLPWHTEPIIEAKAFVDCGIPVSDPICEENGRLRDEVATLKATVCELKRQLQDREMQTQSYSLYRTITRRRSFIPVCHPLLFFYFPKTKDRKHEHVDGKE